MLNADQFKELIIKPALADLMLYSEDAVQLLLFTCAAESIGGTYIHQVNGPALGIYQMEPATYNDLWFNFIMGRSSLQLQLLHSFGCGYMPSEDRLIYDLRFATAMARIFYLRFKLPLPDSKDVNAIWNYYKQFYNTEKGKAARVESIESYKRFII